MATRGAESANETTEERAVLAERRIMCPVATWTEPKRGAEIGRAYINSCYIGDFEDVFQTINRGFCFDHRKGDNLLVGGLLTISLKLQPHPDGTGAPVPSGGYRQAETNRSASAGFYRRCA
ncbi:MAG: hypothetical protein ABJL55_21720 [Roseibium sp.]